MDYLAKDLYQFQQRQDEHYKHEFKCEECGMDNTNVIECDMEGRQLCPDCLDAFECRLCEIYTCPVKHEAKHTLK